MLEPHQCALPTRIISRRPLTTRWAIAFVVLPLMSVGISAATAGTNGTWIDTSSGGLWSVAGNWSGGTIAAGTGGIADFSTLDITADDTVHLDSARTIGQLRFGDTTPSNNWILDNNGNAANTLTMAVNSGSPQITVNNEQASINLVLAGTGVVCNGPGTLLLGGTTDNTGLGLVVFSGYVYLNKVSSSTVHAIGGGGLTINGGTAVLFGPGGDQIYDFANVTVNSGVFDTDGQSEAFNNLSLAGTGNAGNGALQNSAIGGSATITTNGGTTLTANTAIGVFSSTGSFTLNSTISGGFGITKVGAGTLTLGGSGANTFTGTTSVNAGTLMLDKPTFTPAIGSGGLIIGTGNGPPGSVAVLDVNSEQVFFSNVTIQSDGVLNLQNNYDDVGNLTMTGGTVTGGGSYYLVFAGTQVTTQASSYTAAISVSKFYIPSIQFTVAQGTTPSGIDLDVSAPIADESPMAGGFGSITKTGSGAMRLSGNSSFSGGVNLNAGTLVIGNNNAMGTGTLTAGGGALAADSNGPYVVSNPVSLSTTLTVSGGGNFTLAGPVSGIGGLTKTGSGALTLSGVESFTGSISINGGTLAMNTSFSNNVTNSATFIYNSGTFGGRLTNLGTVLLNADFTAGNGMENDGNFALAAGRTFTLNGAGLDNEGAFTMTGGTLSLNPAGNNVNNGNFDLSANLGIGGATLNNSGSLSLNGGLVSGATGLLLNKSDGVIVGTGAIQCSFNNSGGVVAVGNGTMNVSQAFSSSGTIELTGVSSQLRGGALSNSGTIQGLGVVGNPTTNSGTIEAAGGTLFFNGTLLNSANGFMTADAGSKLLVTNGLAVNHGVINLTGGTFDNGGNPLTNAVNGQISGWGIFRTGGTGLDNNGSITFSGGITTVNGPITNEGGKTITVAQNNAIFTGLVTNNASATFNAVNGTATFAGGFVNNGNSNFVKTGGGIVEIDSAPTLANGSTLSVTTGKLRFNVVSGTPTIGTGVNTVVSSGATLELAGSVSGLANGPNRVNIVNNSNAPGILVSGTNQQVGNIDGSGTTQVNAGSDLTANHIIQSALVIGGTSKDPGLATIDASDASGNPLASLAVLPAPTPTIPLGAGGNLADPLDSTTNSDPLADSPSVVSGVQPAAVPEPSSLFLLVICSLAAGSTVLRWRRRV